LLTSPLGLASFCVPAPPPVGRGMLGGGRGRRAMGGVRLRTLTGMSIRSRLMEERQWRSPPLLPSAAAGG
jgi:hypothetical protein